jgi:hypothetical protein
MVNAVEKVRQRLLRATAALHQANIPYAVAGGHAVAAWVSTIDEAGVRNTVDVDLLIQRLDFPAVIAALQHAGFTHRYAAGMELFLDGPDGSPRSGVRIIFANEKVRPEEPVPNPDITDSADAPLFRVLNLQALVQIKLTAFRDKDRTHLRDLIDVGLIDPTWTSKFPAPLAARLQSLFDTPEG